MFKFHKHDDDGQVICQYDIEDCSWPEVVEKFQEFLAGCGYTFGAFNMAEVLDEAYQEQINGQAKGANKHLPLALGDYQ